MLTPKVPNSERRQDRETRCECGQLIAKLAEGGLELKCKRCKRIVVIPFSAIGGWNDLTAGVIS
jgi:hypothetical protein